MYNHRMVSAKSLEGTRNRILNHLRQNRTTNIPEMSRLWGLSRADIRYHINNLVREGLVEPIHKAQSFTHSRGRPTQEYRIASQGDSGNYKDLCLALLNLVKREEIKLVFPDWPQTLAETLAENQAPSHTMTQSLNHSVKWLNQLGYHARWEASDRGPRILFFHCPYFDILPEYPELCQVDQAVLKNLLQKTVVQTAKMATQASAPRACIFEVQLFTR